MSLDFADLEVVYEDLAKALDRVNNTDREVYLCKLSLLMAREVGDLTLVRDMIKTAQNHLETAHPSTGG